MPCAAFASTDSSLESRAPTPTSSHPKVSVWHSSTPRSTTGCSLLYSGPTNLQLDSQSVALFTSSIKLSSPTLITHAYALPPEKLVTTSREWAPEEPYAGFGTRPKPSGP